jgi:hypothetical protein
MHNPPNVACLISNVLLQLRTQQHLRDASGLEVHEAFASPLGAKHPAHKWVTDLFGTNVALHKLSFRHIDLRLFHVKPSVKHPNFQTETVPPGTPRAGGRQRKAHGMTAGFGV